MAEVMPELEDSDDEAEVERGPVRLHQHFGSAPTDRQYSSQGRAAVKKFIDGLPEPSDGLEELEAPMTEVAGAMGVLPDEPAGETSAERYKCVPCESSMASDWWSRARGRQTPTSEDDQWEILKSMSDEYRVKKRFQDEMAAKEKLAKADAAHAEWARAALQRLDSVAATNPDWAPSTPARGVLTASRQAKQSLGCCWAFSADLGASFGGHIAPLSFQERADAMRLECHADRAASQQAANMQVLHHDRPINALPQAMAPAQRDGRWQLLSVAVDSGAAETVIPHKLVTSHPIHETDASRAGVNYASATGDPIPNLGEQILALCMREGSLRSMKFQAAPVSRPLASVKRICKAGHRVAFDDEGSFIENKLTGEINWLREESGNYMLDMWVLPDAEAGFGGQP